LTSISLWLLGRNIVSPEQYDLFRQGTSLILVGVLSMSQVRAFFRVVGALGPMVPMVAMAISITISFHS